MDNAVVISILLWVGMMVFILLELMTPTFGVIAGLALLSLIGSIWSAFVASQTFGLVMLLGSVVAVPAYCVILVKRLPKSRMGRRLFLAEAQSSSGSSQPEATELQKLVGQMGVAATLLRPSGAVKIGGRRFTAMAETGVITEGTPVQVVRFDGMDIVVRPIYSDGKTEGA